MGQQPYQVLALGFAAGFLTKIAGSVLGLRLHPTVSFTGTAFGRYSPLLLLLGSAIFSWTTA